LARDTRFRVILLRAAAAAVFTFLAAFFAVDFGRLTIEAAPIAIAPAIAGISFTMLILR
jgi:hypothetical protein